MRRLLALSLLFCVTQSLGYAQASFEQRMLRAAQPYLPELTSVFNEVWPDAPMRSVIAAQIEKESRWDPNARLCVPRPTCARELGIGLGQFTITPRFNAFAEMRGAHPRLANWGPSTYGDPSLQLLGIVLKDRGHFRQCSRLFTGVQETKACMASSYNGGFGGVQADRRLCGNTKGCNQNLWFGHVENTSLKAKVALQGYGGRSFFDINRAYTRGVVLQWNRKYVEYLGN